jgi:hypothetical protein
MSMSGADLAFMRTRAGYRYPTGICTFCSPPASARADKGSGLISTNGTAAWHTRGHDNLSTNHTITYTPTPQSCSTPHRASELSTTGFAMAARSIPIPGGSRKNSGGCTQPGGASPGQGVPIKHGESRTKQANARRFWRTLIFDVTCGVEQPEQWQVGATNREATMHSSSIVSSAQHRANFTLARETILQSCLGRARMPRAVSHVVARSRSASER